MRQRPSSLLARDDRLVGAPFSDSSACLVGPASERRPASSGPRGRSARRRRFGVDAPGLNYLSEANELEFPVVAQL